MANTKSHTTIRNPKEDMSHRERAKQMWSVHPTDLDRLGFANREDFYHAHIQAAVDSHTTLPPCPFCDGDGELTQFDHAEMNGSDTMKPETATRWRLTIDQFVNAPDLDAYEQEDLRIAVEFALSPIGRQRREDREVALALEVVRLRRWLEWIATADSDAEAALRGDRFWRLDDCADSTNTDNRGETSGNT